MQDSTNRTYFGQRKCAPLMLSRLNVAIHAVEKFKVDSEGHGLVESLPSSVMLALNGRGLYHSRPGICDLVASDLTALSMGMHAMCASTASGSIHFWLWYAVFQFLFLVYLFAASPPFRIHESSYVGTFR